MTDRNSSTVSTTDAINAMRQRGIDDPESLVSCTSADRIIATCEWYDTLSGVTKGLLVKRIREGGIEPVSSEPKVDKRTRFQQIAERFPVTSVAESHQRLQRRRDYEEDCAGAMVVIQADYPFLVARCDSCGFEASYPYRALIEGVLPARPIAASKPIPDPQPQVPPEQHRPPQPDRVIARLSKHHAVKSTGG